MSLCIFESDIILCNGENVAVFNINTGEEKHLLLPKLDNSKDVQSHNEELEAFHGTTNVAFSNDGKYLAVCSNRKQLCLFERKTWQIVANRILARAASKIRFTPKNDIVVADKSGDAYLYSTDDPTKPGILLLGHLSMLLDILVTKDNMYVITADRDEKIRVSMLPNSYNIVSYCLGHEKFVTNIAEVSKDHLISGGGDGSLKIWNYKTGDEIHSVNFTDKFQENDVKQFNEDLKKHDIDESEASLPLKHLCILNLDEDSCMIVASFYCSKRILLYKFVGSALNFKHTLDFVGHFDADNEPLDCSVQKNCLYILMNNYVTCYQYRNCNFVKNDEINGKLNQLNEWWQRMRIIDTPGILIPILYKRKYDNVQEYQERKKMRLNKLSES